MSNINYYLSDYVCDVLNTIPNINNGGCFIAAYSVLQFLRKNNCESNYKLIILYSDESDFNNNNIFIDDKLGNPVPGFHFGWTFKYIHGFTDSTGIFNNIDKRFKYYHILKDHSLIDELYMKLFNYEKWNPLFDRKYIKVIEKILDIKLYVDNQKNTKL